MASNEEKGMKMVKKEWNGVEQEKKTRRSRKWRDVFKLFGFIIDLKKIGFQRKK